LGEARLSRGRRSQLVLLDLVHLHPAGVAGLFLSELVGVDDFGDVRFRQLVLAFAFHEVLRAAGVDEEHAMRQNDGHHAFVFPPPQ
jgi:hypothetical protein